MKGRWQSMSRWLLGAALLPSLAASGLVLTPVSAVADDVADPPGRAARLSYQAGDVAFAAAGEDSWGAVGVNRPLSIGDRLSTAAEARAELEMGGAELRLDGRSALNVVNLDDRSTQLELSSGTANLRIRQLGDGETYEIDTPTMAFVASQPGSYRIDVFPDGGGTEVRLYQGAGTAYGENNASEALAGGQSYEFRSADLSDVIGALLPQGDDFDDFCQQRDGRYRRFASADEVAPEVVGAVDLDGNGQWADDPDYQRVWYPTTVAAGWAPYRYGHWAWIDPWGWTWVDDAPWGFAPFHYGRWVYLRERWAWVPGPRSARPVYSPALVGFVGGAGFSVAVRGGGGPPVGWFPLGPRDVYCPLYRVSRGYFSTINVTNIRTRVDTTVINTYYDNAQVNRGPGGNRFAPDYAYRNRPEATTVVPREVFAGARPVATARIGIDARQLAAAPVSFQSPAIPVRASLGVRAVDGGERRPAPSAVFNRAAVTHFGAPPAPSSLAARPPMIERNQGQPIVPTTAPSRPQGGNFGSSMPAPAGRPAWADQPARAVQSETPPARPEAPVPRGDWGDRPRFQPQPMPERGTPEQRVPMPNRGPDDRLYSQPRPQELPPRQLLPPQSPFQQPQFQPRPPPAVPVQPPSPQLRPQPPAQLQQPIPRPQFQPPVRSEPPRRPEPRREGQPEPRERENHN